MVVCNQVSTVAHIYIVAFPLVYTQSLTQMLQVVAGPIMQVLEEEIETNQRSFKKMDSEKKELLALLQTKGEN